MSTYYDPSNSQQQMVACQLLEAEYDRPHS